MAKDTKDSKDATSPASGKQIDQLTDQLEELNENVESLDSTMQKSVKKLRTAPTFWRGIVNGLGAVIGATVVLALLVYLLQGLAGVPFVGHWFDSIVNQITVER